MLNSKILWICWMTFMNKCEAIDFHEDDYGTFSASNNTIFIILNSFQCLLIKKNFILLVRNLGSSPKNILNRSFTSCIQMLFIRQFVLGTRITYEPGHDSGQWTNVRNKFSLLFRLISEIWNSMSNQSYCYDYWIIK